MKHFRTLLFIFTLLTATAVQAKQFPRPLGTDQRVRHVLYSPNEVYEIHATYGFQTTIEFSDQESIQVASIGDSIAWQVMPVGNRLFIKPVEENPHTNLTVITNKRSYYFSLSTTRPNLMGATYLVRFEYSGELGNAIGGGANTPAIKAASPADYNFNYQLKKNKQSGLIQAFDDKQFTYLQFKDLTNLPAIFLLSENDKESLVNYRIEGPYVVIERVAPRLVMRRGKVVGYLVNKENKANFNQGKSDAL